MFPFQPTWLRKLKWQVSAEYQFHSRNLADQHVIFDMDYHFAKPQSNGGVLLKKPTSPWNTVSMYLALFRSNMKQNRLEKQNFHVMRNCPGCNQMTFPATRSAHELNYEFTSQSWFATHACSRLFSETDIDYPLSVKTISRESTCDQHRNWQQRERSDMLWKPGNSVSVSPWLCQG